MNKRKPKVSRRKKDENLLGLALFGIYLLPGMIFLACETYGGAAILLGLAGSIVIATLSGCAAEPESRCRTWTDCIRDTPGNASNDENRRTTS